MSFSYFMFSVALCERTSSMNYDSTISEDLIEHVAEAISEDEMLDASIVSQQEMDTKNMNTVASVKAMHQRQFLSRVCNRKFSESQDLKSYTQKWHRGRTKLSIASSACTICSKTLKCLSRLMHHIDTHEKPFSCSECSCRFSDLRGLMTRIKRLHGNVLKSCVESSNEGETDNYNTVEAVNISINVVSDVTNQSPSNICTICNKSFKWLSHLVRHKNSHEKPFLCPECDASFSEPKYLRKHIWRLHTMQRAVLLDDISCLNKDSTNNKKTAAYIGPKLGVLNDAMPQQIVADGDAAKTKRSPYVCTICNKSYRYVSELTRHKNKHEKPFLCTDCGARFSDPRSLPKHINKLHGGKLSSNVPSLIETETKKSIVAVTEDSPGSLCTDVRTVRMLAQCTKLHEKRSLCPNADKPFLELHELRTGTRRAAKLKRRGETHIQSLQCPLCKQKFSQTIHLHAHLENVHRARAIGDIDDSALLNLVEHNPIDKDCTCMVCNQTFDAIANLRLHIVTEHGGWIGKVSEKKIVDQLLDVKEVDKAEKETESNDTCDSANIQCVVCNGKFSTVHELHQHEDNHAPSSCPHCGKCYATHRSLKHHIRLKHVTAESEGSNMCNICGKCFKTAAHLQVHMLVHTNERRFKCESCPKTYKHWNTLKDHVRRRHTGARPYVCSTCGKGFIWGTALRYHQRIHNGDAPLSCNICGKNFIFPHYLTVHMKNTHTAERRFECKVCPARFKTGAALKRHMRIHSEKKQYTCTACGHGFTQASNLKTHMRTHTREKPFRCDRCDMRFPHHGTWKKHLLSHT